MADKQSKSNVVKLKQPKQEKKFTQSMIKSFKSSGKGILWASNHKYLGIRTQGATSVFITRKWNSKDNSPNLVSIGDITVIPLPKAVEIHQNNVALISQGINPNRVSVGAIEDKEPTVFDYMEQRLERLKSSGNMSARTIELYEGVLRNHLIDLPRKSTFSSLTDKELQDFYLSKSPSVAKNCMKLLGGTFSKLSKRQKKDNENPADVITRLEIRAKDKDKKKVYLQIPSSKGDIGRFFQACDIALNGYSPETYGDIAPKDFPKGHPKAKDPFWVIPPLVTTRANIDLLIMYLLTSLRKENIRILKWKEVNFKENAIVILNPKGQDEEVVIPLSPHMRALLESRKGNKSPYVFPSASNRRKPISSKTVDNTANTIALVMCYYGEWLDEKDNPLNNVLKKTMNWQSLSKMRYNGAFPELNTMGTKPHGLRRTLSNVADAIGVGGRTIETMLLRKPQDTTGRHYTTTQQETLREAYTKCHIFMDNRIQEYLESGNTPDKFESPLLEFFGIKEKVQKDRHHDNDTWGFTDGKAKEYDYKAELDV